MGHFNSDKILPSLIGRDPFWD